MNILNNKKNCLVDFILHWDKLCRISFLLLFSLEFFFSLLLFRVRIFCCCDLQNGLGWEDLLSMEGWKNKYLLISNIPPPINIKWSILYMLS